MDELVDAEPAKNAPALAGAARVGVRTVIRRFARGAAVLAARQQPERDRRDAADRDQKRRHPAHRSTPGSGHRKAFPVCTLRESLGARRPFVDKRGEVVH